MSTLPATIRALLAGRVSSPETIAEVLREAMLQGAFTGGQPLRQDDLAALFGVSRIPVREALRQLTAEGLVTFHPRRGATVLSLQPAEAEEILEIRHVLECKAAQLAMPLWTPETFVGLGGVLDEAEATGSVDRWSALNFAFHEGLYAPCARPRLLALIRTLNVSVDRYIRLLVSRSDYRLQAQREHRAILAAALVRNGPALAALVEQHAMETARELRRFLTSHEVNVPRRAHRNRMRAII